MNLSLKHSGYRLTHYTGLCTGGAQCLMMQMHTLSWLVW